MKIEKLVKQYKVPGGIWTDCKDESQWLRMQNSKSALVREVTLEQAYEDAKADILHLKEKISIASWIESPDRMGGQFSDDEINQGDWW